MIVQTLNNPINICLINPSIILYYVSLTTPFNPFFFVLLIEKSLEILPRNGIYGFYF